MTPERRLALLFGGVHVVVCAAGLLRPAAYGLGIAADRRTHARLRVLALLDLPFAAAVAGAALRGAPLERRLRVGAGSDLARAAALLGLFRGAPLSRGALVAASVAGSATAWSLAGRD